MMQDFQTEVTHNIFPRAEVSLDVQFFNFRLPEEPVLK